MRDIRIRMILKQMHKDTIRLYIQRSMALVGALIVACGLPACTQQDNQSDSKPLSSAFEDAPSGDPDIPPPSLNKPKATTPSVQSDVIVHVDGQPISRERVVSLLLAGNGPGILEQIVVYTSARRMVDERKLRVRETDVDEEYERSLKQFASGTEVFDREAAESTLNDILNRRNISQAEYRLAMERNACLRALVQADISFTEPQIRQEFERLHGKRATIRHIQVGSMRQAQKIQASLENGEDFEALAKQHSANPNSAIDGGLLRPFTPSDLDVPPLMRETAFSMQPGEISNPIIIDGWFHILKLENIQQADRAEFAKKRAEAQRSLRDRLTETAMQQLYRKLYEQADIQIVDPVLREAVRKQKKAGTIRR